MFFEWKNLFICPIDLTIESKMKPIRWFILDSFGFKNYILERKRRIRYTCIETCVPIFKSLLATIV